MRSYGRFAAGFGAGVSDARCGSAGDGGCTEIWLGRGAGAGTASTAFTGPGERWPGRLAKRMTTTRNTITKIIRLAAQIMPGRMVLFMGGLRALGCQVRALLMYRMR